MMADHWKSIANLLGAPGVDEPEVEAQVETQAEPAPRVQPASVHTTRNPATAASRKNVRPAEAHQEPTSEKDFSTDSDSAGPKTASDLPAGDSHSQSEDSALADKSSAPRAGDDDRQAAELHFDSTQPIPDEALSFKSLRPKPSRGKTPAQPESTKPTSSPTPPAARSFSEPSPPQTAEARREAPRMPDRSEPNTPTVSPPSEPPARRKSSWESLANMFNIKVDRSKSTEPSPETERPAAEPVQPRGMRPTNESTSAEDQPFSIFAEERPSRSNPALDAMFGETPQPSKSARDDWGKPRVIDDLGWDDDDKRTNQREDSRLSSSDQADAPSGRSSSDVASEGDDEEAPRRGRRRRRGRRGRSDSGSSPTAAESTPSWGGLDDIVDDTTEGVTDHHPHDDPWGEPDSFELIQSDESLDDQDLDADEGSDELSADGEVLRRSSRRRRRGRSSSTDRDTSESTSGGPDLRGPGRGRTPPSPRSTSDDSDGPVSFKSDRDRDSRRDRIEAADQPDAPRAGKVTNRADGDDSDDRGSRSRRGRRSGSSDRDAGPRRVSASDSPSRMAADSSSRSTRRPTRPSDEQGPIEDSFDDATLGPDGDEDESLSGEGQHRRIPTWADSIASLIQTNTENRKRGDNRNAPRGRPRGRR